MGEVEATIEKELEKVNSALTKLGRVVHPKWNQKSKLSNNLPETLTSKIVFDIVVGVREAVSSIMSIIDKTKSNKQCPKIATLEARVRDLESDADSTSQKLKTGSLILTQPREGNIILKKEALEASGASVASHATQVIEAKTGVKVDESDLKAAHFLPNGNVKVKFSDAKEGSKFKQVVEKIKKPLPDERKVPVYLNFDLTKKRSALLYEVRRLKKQNKIFRFFTDFDGTISIIQEEGSKDKVKLTRSTGRSGRQGERSGKQPQRTLTAQEFLERYDPDYQAEVKLVEEVEERNSSNEAD